VSTLNPFFYLIDGFRYAFFGVSDVAPSFGLFVVGAACLAVSFATLQVLRSGWRLRR
jgi:ABC-2 type transport system permease protein